MKKITLSIIALAAFSTASFASLRDVTTPYGAQDSRQAGAVTSTDALVIPNYDGSAASNGKAGDDLGLGGSNRR